MPISSLNSTGKNTINAGGDLITSNVLLTGRLDVAEIREVTADVLINSNTILSNYQDSNIFYCTSTPAANFTINLTNVPIDNNRVFTVSYIIIQGSTGYIPTAFQIEGDAQTIKWNNSTAPIPTSTSGKVDIFTFTVFRRLNSWEVLGNVSRNF
jgi:hypothetical protein